IFIFKNILNGVGTMTKKAKKQNANDSTVINHPVSIDMQIELARKRLQESQGKLYDTCIKQDLLVSAHNVDIENFKKQEKDNNALISAYQVIELQKSVMIKNVKQNEFQLNELTKKRNEL